METRQRYFRFAFFGVTSRAVWLPVPIGNCR
jgi:hypothetical protein